MTTRRPERRPEQQCAEYREKARKRSYLEAFSRDFLTSLASALNDGSRKRLVDQLRQIRDATCAEDGGYETPAQAILKARKAIGRDNDAYLQCGLMVLWCGDDMENDLAHTLYPSSLTLSVRPERPGYGEERVVEKLLDQTATQLRTLRTFVESVAPRRIAYLLSVSQIAAYVDAILRTPMVVDAIEGMTAIRDLLLPREEDGDENGGLLGFAMPNATNVSMYDGGKQRLERAIRTLVKQEDGAPAAALSALLGTLCDRTEAQGLVEQLVGSNDGGDARKPWQPPDNKSTNELCKVVRRQHDTSYDGNDDPLPRNTSSGNFASLRRALLWMHDVYLWNHCRSDDEQQAPVSASVPMAIDVQQSFAPDVVGGSENGVRAAFVNARSVRMVTSLAINLYRSGACDLPPHLLNGEQIETAYGVPLADETDLLQSAVVVESNPRPAGVYKMDYTTTASEIIVKWVSRSNKQWDMRRVLWTPTRANDDDEVPHIGGLSLTPMSLHVSYATYLSKAIDEVPGQDLSNRWAAAVFKLEMMPSLAYIYERVARGDDIQEAISSPNTPNDEARTSSMLQPDVTNPLVCLGAEESYMYGIVHYNAVSVLMGGTAQASINSKLGLPSNELLDNGNPPPRALSSADFGQRMGGGRGEENPLRTTLSRVPAFASPDGVAEIATLLRQLHGTKRRLEAQRDAYQGALDDIRSGRNDAASYGSAAGESSLPDADDRGRRDAIWQDALRELSIGGDRLYTFLKVSVFCGSPFPLSLPHLFFPFHLLCALTLASLADRVAGHGRCALPPHEPRQRLAGTRANRSALGMRAFLV